MIFIKFSSLLLLASIVTHAAVILCFCNYAKWKFYVIHYCNVFFISSFFVDNTPIAFFLLLTGLCPVQYEQRLSSFRLLHAIVCNSWKVLSFGITLYVENSFVFLRWRIIKRFPIVVHSIILPIDRLLWV